MDELIITKQIAKQGNQSIIVLPKVFDNLLKPKDLVQVRITLVERDKG